MFLELHLLENGVDRGPIPSAMGVTISPVFCDFGTISFKYPRNGKKFALLDGKDEIEIVPWIDGVPHPEFGGLVQEISGDDVAESSIIDYTGLGYLRLLDEARVYPYNWPSFAATDPSWHFTDATAGEVMGALGLAARNRGTITDVSMASFTNTTDSNGGAWAKQITLEVKPGATLVDVLNSLHDNGMVEFQMVGRDLRLYNADTFGVDRTTQAAPVVFRKGRDLKDSPRKISSRDRATVLLAAGKEDAGIYHEEVDATAEAAVGRRIEGYASNGNITDAGTLNAFSEVELSGLTQSKMEKTHGLVFARVKSPRPIRDFGVGDWCWSDVGKGMERLRVKQWVLSMDDKGLVTGSVTLNDLFAEAEEKLARRIAGIVGGSTITGESKAEPSVADQLDTTPPATPAAPSLSSLAYTDDQGNTAAQVTASWPAVTANADGTVLEDLQGYFVRWRFLGDDETQWRSAGYTDGTFQSWSPVVPGAVVEASVQAVDRSGNASGWSANSQVTTGSDVTPPEAPAAPTVSNRLGLVEIQYDATTASGAAWPVDLSYFRVHASTVNNFTPTDATLIDTVVTAGSSFFNAPYGTTVYAKLEAVDYSGNIGPASAQGSGSAQQVVSADVFDGAIGSAKLADLAVTTAKINDLAVNDAKIGSVNVGKLTAGVLNAAVTLSGRIATALTGARTEMNALGFVKFASDGVTKMIDFTGTTNLLTGTLQTDLAPNRRIVSGASGTKGQIQFIAPDGTVSILQSVALVGGAEGVSLGLPITGANPNFWNTLRIDSTELAFIDSKFVHFGFGGAAGNGGDFRVMWASSKGNSTTQPVLISRLTIDETNFFYTDKAGKTRLTVGSTQFGYTDASGQDRIIIDAGTFFLYDDDNVQRMAVGGNDTFFNLPTQTSQTIFSWSGQDGRIAFNVATARPDVSARLNLLNSYNFGAQMRYLSTSAGASSRVEFNDAGGSGGYVPITAGAYTNGSSETTKQDIAKFTGDPLAILGASEVVTFRRKGGKSADGKKSAPAGRVEHGFIAENTPPEITVKDADDVPYGVDITAILALAVAAIQQMNTRLVTLEGKK